MKFVVDTGAAITLACSLYFKSIRENYELIITNAIEQELLQFAEYSDILGLKAQEVLRLNFPKKMPKVLLSLNLEKGEIEVFSLAHEEKLTALTDDAHAARVVREKMKVSVKPSFYVLLLLYKKKKITKEELLKDINSILISRNWLTGSLWDYAKKEIEKL